MEVNPNPCWLTSITYVSGVGIDSGSPSQKSETSMTTLLTIRLIFLALLWVYLFFNAAAHFETVTPTVGNETVYRRSRIVLGIASLIMLLATTIMFFVL